MRRVAVAVLAAVAGCKSASPTVIDVSVTVDGALGLDTVTVSASATGKPDFHKDLPSGATVQISIEPRGLSKDVVVTVEARGSKMGMPRVIDRAKVAPAAGQRAAVSLHLATDCDGVLTCTAEQTCKHGACVAITPPATDGGMSDGASAETPGPDGAGGGGGGADGTDGTPVNQCIDSMKNGAETDIDCGGGTCPKCQRDRACKGDGDCVTGSCKAFFCALASGPPNWLPGPSLNVGRGDMPVGIQTFANRQALLVAIGGRDDGNPDTTTTYEVLDTSQNPPVWSVPAPLPSGGFADNPAATDATGRILAFSSFGTWSYTGNNGWGTSLAVMPGMRDATAATTATNGQIWVMGGSTGGPFGSPVSVVELYDPVMDKWSYTVGMPTARSFLAAATGLDGRIYAIGGLTSPPTGGVLIVGTVEVFSPAAGAWLEVAEIPDAAQELAAVGGPDGRIYALGGRTSTALLASVNAYSPGSDRWQPVVPLNAGRFGLGATVTPDGRIWAVGGLTSFVSPLKTVEVYGPVVTVNPQSGAAGDSAAVSGSNFAADADVGVYLGSATGTPLATGHTNSAGALPAAINFTVPNMTPGDKALVVMDNRSQYPITLLFRVR